MKPYETIVVPVGLSPLDDLAVSTAARVAKMFGASRLHLVHVIQPYAFLAADPTGLGEALSLPLALDAAKAALDAIAVPESLNVTREVRTGPTVAGLVASMEETGAELAVLASHRRGRLGRFVLGSVAGAFIRAAPSPVLIVGADRMLPHQIRSIIAAIDSSPIAAEVTEAAAAFASQTRARLTVISACDALSALRKIAEQEQVPLGLMLEKGTSRYRSAIEDLVAKHGQGLEIEVNVHMHEHPKRFIVEVAEDLRPDLLVIGTSGHNAWQRMMLGSCATHALAQAGCPVLVVPARAHLLDRDQEHPSTTGATTSGSRAA